MGTFLIVIVVLVIGAFALIAYKKSQADKAQAEKVKSMNNSVRQIQDNYKALVSELQIDGIIDTAERAKLIKVANNYFVFQPINAINLSHFADLINLLTDAISFVKNNTDIEPEKLGEMLSTLAERLPEETRDFNANYYLNHAPGLFFDFSESVKSLNESQPDSIDAEEEVLADEDATESELDKKAQHS